MLNAVPGQVCLHRLHRLQHGEPHLRDLLVRDEEGHTAGHQKVATTQAGLIQASETGLRIKMTVVFG